LRTTFLVAAVVRFAAVLALRAVLRFAMTHHPL